MGAPPTRRFPDSLVLVFGIVLLAQVLRYVVPKGTFRRATHPDSKQEMVVPGTYARIPTDEVEHLPPWAALAAISEGLEKAGAIMFLIFIVGGVIAVLRATGAIDAMLHRLVEVFSGSPWLLIAGTMLVFSFGSCTVGMGDEYVPLIPILIAMSLAMRMDGLVALGMVWVPYGIGWGCAGLNPLGVLIAQDIAGVPPTSRWGMKLVLMVILLAVAFHHVYRYARRVRADPSRSFLASCSTVVVGEGVNEAPSLSPRGMAIIGVFLGGLALFVYGVSVWHWYIEELNAVFLGVGIISAAVARLSPGEVSQRFIQGASEMTAAA